MKILLLEYDLLWSIRLKKSFETLGHEVSVSPTGELVDGPDVAIVNLSSRRYSPSEVIQSLQTNQVKVIAHAGHKENHLLEVGHSAGADYVCTNGELALNPGKALATLFPQAG